MGVYSGAKAGSVGAALLKLPEKSAQPVTGPGVLAEAPPLLVTPPSAFSQSARLVVTVKRDGVALVALKATFEEVVRAPRLSVATAFKVILPAVGTRKVTLKGDLVAVPTRPPLA